METKLGWKMVIDYIFLVKKEPSFSVILVQPLQFTHAKEKASEARGGG